MKINSTPITKETTDGVSRKNKESAHGHLHYYHTDGIYRESTTSRRTYPVSQQSISQGTLIEQNGALIFVPAPSSQQDGSGQRSHSGSDNDKDDDGYQWGSSNNNDDVDKDENGTYANNSNNDDDAMARPQGDDQVFQELDCSQFLHMDDPPIECLSQGYPGAYPVSGTPGFGQGNYYGNNNTMDDDQFSSNGTALMPQYPLTGTLSPGDESFNATGMATGMADTNPNNGGGGGDGDGDGDVGDESSASSDDVSGTKQQGLPPENLVTVQIGIAMSPPPTTLDPINRILSEVVTGILDAQTYFRSIYLGNLNPPDDYPQRHLLLAEKQKKEQQQDEEENGLSRQLEPYSTYGQSQPSSSSNNHPPVDLVHAWTILDPTPMADNNLSLVWYWAKIDYAALIGGDGMDAPSTSQSQSNPPPRPIRRPDHLGNITALCQSTVNRSIDNGVLLHRLVDAIEDDIEHAKDGQSGDAKWLSEQLGLVAIAPIGPMGWGPPMYVADQGIFISYTTPLDLKFGLREWLGLALAIGTVLVTLLLFGGASYYQQRQAQKQWSTALMTEHGIDDILKVGWQYHQQAVPTSTQSQPQLFLHVFEKQGFRSDDDSLLYGGVEREELARNGGVLLVYDEVSREDDSSSSNRPTSSGASTGKTPSTTQTSKDTKSKR